MAILYKHYGNGIGENYLENPTFLLSTPNDLNDPFESNIAKDIMELIVSQYSQEENAYINAVGYIPVIGFISKAALSSIKGLNLNKELHRQSIISLTETNRDILMWAHYSDKHQGCAIGYDLDLIIEDIKKKNSEHETFTLEPKVYKVNYRNVRFEPDNILNEKNIQRELLRLITTTKSDHWIYEKEHRLIIPLGCANIIRLFPMEYHGEKDDKKVDKIYSDVTESTLIKTKTQHNEHIDIVINENSKLSDVESYITKLRKHFKVLPLLSIPKESIRTIHFGARAGKSRIVTPLKIINRTQEYQSVKIFKYTVSNERFELIQQPLSSDTFNGDISDSL
ncbi:DUF2971 domain-containing protein [Aeromonas hydrophila]|uniref:DUF2971 domain-containing protein n=1 Tax=Aeromonas hydrophila TaxID=644 RepID=UPI0035BA04AF